MKLRNKILALAVLLVLLLGLSIAIFVKTSLIKSLLSGLREKGLSDTIYLAQICTNDILTNDKLGLRLMLNEYVESNKEVEYVFVLDMENTVLVHTFNEIFPRGLKDVNRLNSTETHSIQHLTTDKGTFIDIAVPISDGQLGIMHTGFSEEYIKNNIDSLIESILWIITFVLAVGGGLAFILSSVITNPVRKLTEAAKEVGGGKLNTNIEITSNDEIGELAYAFNGMIDSLSKVQGDLVSANQRLQEEISERKHLLAELAQKNKELEQVLYVTSHDLRSPLVNVEGFSRELDYSLKELISLCHSDEVTPEIRNRIHSIVNKDISESMNFIRNSISKMDTLIAGVLKVSRTGRVELKIEDIDMSKVMDSVVKNYEFILNQKGVKVEISSLPSCRGDQDQINQVFSNIIDNAIKYMDPTRTGLIKVSGQMKEGRSVYCIEDNGVGIEPGHQDKIFEIFHRLETVEAGGEGLGLTIVHKIVEMLKGQIWVESESGKGSKFFISLPS